MRTINTLCILFALHLSSFGQISQVQKESADSIVNWINSNIDNDSIEVLQLGLLAVSKAKSADQLVLAAKIHEALSFWHFYHDQFSADSSVYHDLKALEYSVQANDSVGMATNLSILSTDYMNVGKVEEAQKAALEAIYINEQLGDEEGLAQNYGGLASIYVNIEEYDKVLQYTEPALAYHTKKENYSMAASTLINMARAQMNLEKFAEAHDNVDIGLGYIRDYIPDDVGVHIRLRELKAQIYLAQQRYREALKEANWVYDFALSEAGEESAQSYRGTIGEVLYAQNNYAKALPHLVASIEGAPEEAESLIYPIIDKIGNSYYNIGDFKKAHDFQKRHSRILDELNKKKIANLETEGIIKYETGKKDQAIADQEQEIAQKNRIQYLGIGIVALLLSLLGSLFWSYRKNKNFTAALSIKNNENEFLVKEIHHRVKNNLQILSSLLSLQSNYLKDEAASDAIKEGQNRVESMGLIHQRLYSGDAKTAVDVKEYVDDLCEHLSESFLLVKQNVEITADIKVRQADVETAIPLGLIINELVTNSIKYAFDGRGSGEIKIKIWENQSNQLCLEVSDDGLGDASKSAFKDRSTNFGSDLVKVLMKKLKGTLEQSSASGYNTTITFDRYKLVG